MPQGGAEVDIAVLFADVRGSTGLGQQLPPEDFANLMNRFYRAAIGVLLNHGAIVDKLVGDEVIALFIPGYCGSDYRLQACLAAEALVRALGHGRGEDPWLPVGVAVHAGPAFVGNVGSPDIVDFTALGDTVNTAARLQSAADVGEVLLSEAVYSAIARWHQNLEPRALTLRGIDEPMVAYALRPALEA